MPKLTPHSLATRALALADDIDGKRWEAARLAAQARADRVPNWADILSVAFRRATSTIYGWVRVIEWMETYRITAILPISFYDSAERYSDKVSDKDIRELLKVYASTPGATVESFRAELHALAAPADSMVIHTWLEKESVKLRRKAETFGIPARVRDGILLAADMLDDVKVTA